MTVEEITGLAAQKGAEVAIEEFNRKMRQLNSKDSLRERTRKLLKGYRPVKKALGEKIEITEDEQRDLYWRYLKDLMGVKVDPDEKYKRIIGEDEKRRAHDVYALKRIDKALEMYYDSIDQNDELAVRRYNALCLMHIDTVKQKPQDIADALHISRDTLYRDINKALDEVALYLLGYGN